MITLFSIDFLSNEINYFIFLRTEYKSISIKFVRIQREYVITIQQRIIVYNR